MRILHIFPSFEAGGAQLRFVNIANAIGREISHSVLAMDGNRAAATRLRPELHVRFLDPPATKNSLVAIPLVRALLRRESPDLVMTYNWGALDGVVAARLAGIPTLHTEDGFGPDEAVQLKLRRVMARRVVLNRIEGVIVPSQTLLKIAKHRYCIAARKLHFVPNGIDTEKYKPGLAASSFRDEWNIPAGAFVVGFVGRLRREKNVGLLLEAFAHAQMPNCVLVLVGDGECRLELERYANALGIADRTRFTGSLNCAAYALGAFDLFAMSSATEQMPLSLLEAMACGLPAVCTDVGDCAAILNSGPGPNIVPVNGPAAYAAALAYWASDAGLCRAAGIHNREVCLRDYSQDRMVARYRELFHASMGQ